ncbi:hypothetical protein J2Z50_006614 [Ensifer mexicanus]|nr:hypothetical protein [Sinorhizobium mexicanum]
MPTPHTFRSVANRLSIADAQERELVIAASGVIFGISTGQ